MFPYTNSVTEGYNNKIKVLKRLAYGLGGHSEKIPTPTIDKEPFLYNLLPKSFVNYTDF
ncbi:transposase [Caldanaerobacter subterraneus]|nr:transposase [Caldanaerobacter subterraneus]